MDSTQLQGYLYIKSRNTWSCVCGVCESVYLYQHYKCWLQQRRPVETCRSWLKCGEMRRLRKASRGLEKKEKMVMVNHWKVRENRGEELVWELLWRVFLSHWAATAESGRITGENWPRWSCNFLSVVCVWALHLQRDILKHSCSPSARRRPVR